MTSTNGHQNEPSFKINLSPKQQAAAISLGGAGLIVLSVWITDAPIYVKLTFTGCFVIAIGVVRLAIADITGR
jgi:hypothetical protein